MNNELQRQVITKAFNDLHFRVIFWNSHPNANGVDCYVQKPNEKPMSVEIKTVKLNKTTKALSVEPVSEHRKQDDFIAIIINKNYVLIEPMEQHLRCCGDAGYRAMTMFR